MKLTYETAYLPDKVSSLPPGPWLILAPHPDDEAFGMGGALLLAKKVGIDVDVIFLTDGGLGGIEQEDLAAVRETEARIVAKKLAIRKCFFWGEPDRGLMVCQRLIDQLKELIKTREPKTLFFPSLQEPHPDHRAAAFLAWESLRQTEFSVVPLSYDISVQGLSNYLIDISSVIDQKREAMLCYASQLSENKYIERILGLNQSRAWSLPLSVSHAESFYQWPKEDRPINALLMSKLALQCSSSALPAPSPLVSVITRTQNRPDYLREAIRSVVSQTYSNIELIVVNDGGKCCKALVKEEATGHIRQFYYQHLEQQAGRSHAANVGLELSTGEFLIFLDDDDWFTPEHIQKLVSSIVDEPDVDVVYTGTLCVDEKNQPTGRRFSTLFDPIRLLSGNYIPIHSVLFSRKILEKKCRFDEVFHVFEDWDFWIQVSFHTTFKFIDGCSSIYRSVGESGVGLSADDPGLIDQSRLILYKKWLPRLSGKQLLQVMSTVWENQEKKQYIEVLKSEQNDRDQLIQEQEQLIQGREQLIQEQEQTIKKQSNTIEILSNDLRQLRNSTCWKITSPLRVVISQIKKIIQIIHLIKSALVFGGGLKNTLQKIWKVLCREGMSGVSRRMKKMADLGQVQSTVVNSEAAFFQTINHVSEEQFYPRVLIIAECSIAQCTKYRVTQKQEMFKEIGVESTVCDWADNTQCLAELPLCSLVIFYRTPGYIEVLNLISEAKRLKIPVFWEVDDFIFDRGVLAKSKTLSEIDQQELNALLEGANLYRKAMLSCGRGIASTIGLADAMIAAGVADVSVVENAIDQQSLDYVLKTTDTVQIKKSDGFIRVVYGSGTTTHDIDFLEASAALLIVLKKFKNVKLRIIGVLNLPDSFSQVNSQVEVIPLCSFEEYLGYLAECDISIAPLEKYIFNDSKSNIKFIEASLLKLPSICSPRAAFSQVIKHGKNGYLCETPEKWAEALIELIESNEQRTQVGLLAYDYVMATYRVESVSRTQLLPLVDNHLKKNTNDVIRVLSVNVYYSPRSFGGATVVAEEVNKLLKSDKKYEVFVLTTLPEDQVRAYTVRRYEVDGITVFALGLPRFIEPKEQFENPRVDQSFEKVLNLVKPDLVHFHSIQGLGVSLADICSYHKISYMITLHDAWWLCGRQFMINQEGSFCDQQKIDLGVCASCVENASLNRYRQKRLHTILQESVLLLAPSKYFADFYQQNGFTEDQVVVNKNGIKRPLSDKKNRRKGPVVFGYVGGNTEIKGVHLVRKVFVDSTPLDVKLVVVDNVLNLGYSSYDADFFGNLKNIEIVPGYTQATIDDFFAGIDVLLFPTQWKESFGLTVREALARNIWVICTDAGGVVEDIVHGENGFIVDFYDQGEAFLQAVLETVKLFQQFSEGSEIVFKASDIRYFDVQAKELGGLYQRVVDKKNEMSKK